MVITSGSVNNISQQNVSESHSPHFYFDRATTCSFHVSACKTI